MSHLPTNSEDELALDIAGVTHRYGDRVALDSLTLSVRVGEVFSILGPNGSGKSTLFRLISTLVRLQVGSIKVFGDSVLGQQAQVRQQIAVVFQHPSLDIKLTVLENLRCAAVLYNLDRKTSERQIQQALKTLQLEDRANDFCEQLSGGLKRRVELAKGILHAPRLLLLDEPSTGLDPAARLDLWQSLQALRNEHGTTVVLTTHLLDEADKCDRVAILHQGKLAAWDSPDVLRREAGQSVLTIGCDNATAIADELKQQFSIESMVIDRQVRIARDDAFDWIGPISKAFGNRIESVTLGRPGLEDVFIAKTGHRFWETDPQSFIPAKPKRRR